MTVMRRRGGPVAGLPLSTIIGSPRDRKYDCTVEFSARAVLNQISFY